jgi:hypothetical protein
MSFVNLTKMNRAQWIVEASYLVRYRLPPICPWWGKIINVHFGPMVFFWYKVHVLWFNRSSKTSGLKPGARVKGARGKSSKLLFPSPGNTPTIKVIGEGRGEGGSKKALASATARSSGPRVIENHRRQYCLSYVGVRLYGEINSVGRPGDFFKKRLHKELKTEVRRRLLSPSALTHLDRKSQRTLQENSHAEDCNDHFHLGVLTRARGDSGTG